LFVEEEDTLPLFDSSSVPVETGNANGANGHSDINDLITFYLKCDPQYQYEEIIVITYYYQIFQKKPFLTLEDYRMAYKALQEIPVVEPPDLKSTVHNARKHNGFLHVPESGQFKLTRSGLEHMKGMLAAEAE